MNDYESVIKSAPTVFVEFYASWCPHCQRMMPIIAEIRELIGQSVPIYQYDIDKNQAEAEEAHADSIPTFIIYQNGRPVWRHSGEMDGNELLRKIQQYSAVPTT